MTTPHGFMPGAIVKNIPPGSSDPAIVPVAVSQHIAVSNSDSLFGLFSNDGGIESHFYIRKDGTIEQYRSIFFQADAQFDSNHPDMGVVSVEHQGGVGADLNVPMPKAQLDAFHRVILFVASQSPGFRFQVCPAYNKPGVGYHAMFAEWNLNHHSCPGAARIAQFNAVTVPWLRTAGKPKPKPVGPKRLSASDIWHVHGKAFYYEEDSLRGAKLAIAKALGIDFDVQKTKDGVLVVCHGPRLLARGRLGGFYDPLGLIPVTALVSELTWAEVSRLRSRDHKQYRISRADTLIPHAVKAGIKVVEPEAKTSHITAADWTALKAKVSDPSRLRVKAYPKFLPSLKAAHDAGFPTIALTHAGQRRLPRSAQGWLDYFRGKTPTWT